MFSLASSATLPIPPKPLFHDFQFKTIGKEPALLMRLSTTHGDDLDMDDIYEDPPLSPSSVASGNIPNGTFSRPTLLQTLGGELGLIDNNDDAPSVVQGIYRDVVNVSPLPTSPQAVPYMEAAVMPNPLPNPASPLPMSHPGGRRIQTSSKSPCPAPKSTPFAASPLNNFERCDREGVTLATSLSPHLSPSPNDLVASASNNPRVPDLRPVYNVKALKKVVALKDKFNVVSATAHQSQRHAKQALISAQRSAAAAQFCLAAAESFVPCVGDVISAIRRMGLASGAHGPASEWIAVLRDLEDGLQDLNQWSCNGTFDTFRREALGQKIPRNNHASVPSPSSSGAVAGASCSGFPLTSVEEEAQEALRAWNQLDQQIHETADGGKSGRQPGSQSGDGVPPESDIRMEDEAEISLHKDVINQVSEGFAKASSRSLDEDRGRLEQGIPQAAGKQPVETEAAEQSRGEVEKGPLETVAEAADGEDSQERHNSQQPAQTCEESHHNPGFLDGKNMSVSTAASSGNVTSKNPGLQDRDARNLHATLATPNTENHMPAPPMFNLSSDDMQAGQRQIRSSLPSAPSDQVSVTPRNGNVDHVSGSLPHPSSPTSTESKEVGSTGSEIGKGVVPRSKMISPEAQPSDRRRDMNRTSPIKSEPVEPQLNLAGEENKVIDELVLNEAVEVNPSRNIPLKPETSVVYLPPPGECEIGTKISRRVSSDLAPPLPEVLPAVTRNLVAADTPPLSTVSAIGPVEVATVSPHDVTNNSIRSVQPTDTPVSSSAPTLPMRLAPRSQPAPAPVHSPTSSTVPLALRVERPAYPTMPDLDDAISPDLMSSRGWDADENDGSRKGSKRSPSRRSLSGLESLPRSRSRGVESPNRSVDYSRPPVVLHSRRHPVSRSPERRRRISSVEHPAPLIGKKRPRDEMSQPGPPRSRRNWTRAAAPFVSEDQTSHITTVPQVDIRASPHFKRLEPVKGPIAQPSYNPNNLQRSGPSLMHRLEPAPESSVAVASPRTQRPFRPQQQQPQNRYSGYNMDQNPSSNGRQSHHSYNDDQTPELLNRMLAPQQIMFDPAQSYSNFGQQPSNRPHGRGRGFGGQGGASQQQRFSRKPPSLFDRLDNRG